VRDDDEEDRPRRRPALDYDDEEDRPRRRRPKKKPMNRGLLIGLGIGGAALLLLVCGGVVLWLVIGPLAFNSKLTPENIQKVQPGMTLEDVEAILGPGRLATRADVQAANEYSGPVHIAPAPITFRPGTTKYVWRNGNTWFFVDIDDGSKKLVGTYSVSHS
jgi:hypothetical protein